jgi:PAS domain S-box-containing protein
MSLVLTTQGQGGVIYSNILARRFGGASFLELSQRETQLLQFAREGLTDQAIANELGISLATIATYWGRIRIKFGPLSRTEIVGKYIESQSTESIEGLENEVKILRQQLEMQQTELSGLMVGLKECCDSIVLFDTDHKILFANETTLKWMGVSFEEAIGRQMVDFWPEDRKSRWQDWHQMYLQNPYDDELRMNRPVYIKHKDGTVRTFVANLTPFMTSEGMRTLAIARNSL